MVCVLVLLDRKKTLSRRLSDNTVTYLSQRPRALFCHSGQQINYLWRACSKVLSATRDTGAVRPSCFLPVRDHIVAGYESKVLHPEAVLSVFERIELFDHPQVNRYGPWLDVNLVRPTGPDSCVTIFDYFLEAEAAPLAQDAIDAALKDSDEVCTSIAGYPEACLGVLVKHQSCFKPVEWCCVLSTSATDGQLVQAGAAGGHRAM